MNYSPNRAAQALKTGRYGAIGVITYNIADAFAAECISAMEEYLTESSYRAMWISCAYAEQSKTNSRILLGNIASQVDGIIVISSNRFLKDADVLHCWADTHLPIVSIIRTIPGDIISSVTIDEPLATTLLMEHLLELGHRNIAFCYSNSHPPSADARHQSYREILIKKGLKPEEKWQIPVDGTAKGGHRAGMVLTNLSDRPTAIIGFNDLTSVGLLSACFEQGLKVGSDISIASFDNIQIAESTSPPLTSVGPRYDALVRLAINELKDQITSADPRNNTVHHHILTPELFVRESTGQKIN